MKKLSNPIKVVAVLMAFALLSVAAAQTLNWYYSTVQDITITGDPGVSLDPVTSFKLGSVVTFSGVVSGLAVVSGVSVTIFDGSTSLASGVTDSTGHYSISYPVAGSIGQVTHLKAGIQA